MNGIFKRIAEIGIVPVISVSDAEKAVPLARALEKGGIPCAEITFRTAEGKEAIQRIAREVPGVLVGAGTVLSKEQVDHAIDAGASFIVSPGFNEKVVDYCMERGVPVVPGCLAPSDMERAIERGLETVKFFPAEAAGGLPFIKAVAAPYPMLSYMPTGGVNADNIAGYLGFEKVVACGGSWMVPKAALEAGDFDMITGKCREAMQKVLGFQLLQMEVNDKEALRDAKIFEMMFGISVKERDHAGFTGGGMMDGKKGQITVGVSSVMRGQAYLERMGWPFRAGTDGRAAAGGLPQVFLKEESAGFSVRLIQV